MHGDEWIASVDDQSSAGLNDHPRDKEQKPINMEAKCLDDSGLQLPVCLSHCLKVRRRWETLAVRELTDSTG